MFEVSSTSTSVARSCWQKFNFQYIHGLRKKTKPIGMTIGSAVHDAFERHYLGRPHNEVLDSIHNGYNKLIQQSQDAAEVEDLTIGKYTSLGMYEFYPKQLSKFEAIEAEKSFKVSIVRGIKLVGRVDGSVTQRNLNWIREVKTTGLGLRQFQGRAQVSYQASAYIYGLEKATGKHYEGIMYDTIRKPALRKRVNETAESFGRRIYQDYKDTLTDQKKHQSYYERIYIYRSKYEMKCFEEDTRKIAREMKRRIKSKDFHRNPDACWTFNSPCEFMPICWKENWDEQLIESLYNKRSAGLVPDTTHKRKRCAGP